MNFDFLANDNFPIHVTYMDDMADPDPLKPGGYFTKDLYERDFSVSQLEQYINNRDEAQLKRIQEQLGDLNYDGFVRTDKTSRLHYKVQREKQKKLLEEKR